MKKKKLTAYVEELDRQIRLLNAQAKAASVRADAFMRALDDVERAVKLARIKAIGGQSMATIQRGM